MASGRSSSSSARVAEPEDRAFVLRVSPYGESDAVVKLLTERRGIVSAIGKRAKRRMVLEPFHTLRVSLAKGGGELYSLRAAEVGRARIGLLSRAEALDAAGVCTRWTRSLCPEHTEEKVVFAALERALDMLDVGAAVAPLETAFGLVLLESLGFALELDGCARCGRPRPRGKAALLAGRHGGVVCAACRAGSEAGYTEIAGAVLDLAADDPWALRDGGLAPIVAAAVEARTP